VALMADLSKPVTTISAMDDEKIKARKSFDSIGISMSSLDTECDRALWYLHRWASKPETVTGGKIDRFETGNIWETRLLRDLTLIPGVIVWETDTNTGKQFKVYTLGGHVRGKLDGEIVGLPEKPFEVMCVECKSHNDRSFKDLEKKSVKESKLAHWWQCQFYMHKRERKWCLYIAVNKNDETKKYVEFVAYDAEAVARMEKRLENIINLPKAPERISENPKHPSCMFCNHTDVCRLHAFGRIHCRTCIHSTPSIELDSEEATWRCEKHNKVLSLDEQRIGCEHHLFHPDVVPGEQVDAGETWVTYVLGDGKEWINGGPETTLK
jgi:hypothetical protein